MSLTVPQVLEALEAQIAHHREREAFHAGQEAAHRERRACHAAELEGLTKHYENLRESLGVIEGFVAPRPQSGRPSLTRLEAWPWRTWSRTAPSPPASWPRRSTGASATG